EAALAAEAVWELREAAASMASTGFLDMDVDTDDLQLLTVDAGGDVSILAPGPSTLNKHMLDGEELEVPATNPMEDINEGVSRLIALQKRL
ncbi:unnamed protein product, partial [Urochloa humidicola]